jgi:uncharacterized protein (DUF1697 family)
MPRYVAFLRGISPVNATMPDLKRCFEAAGFATVRTILASGNLVFDARSPSEEAIERKAEASMQALLGHAFTTIVRPVSALQELLARDPYAACGAAPGAKRVVSFLREPARPKVILPLESEGATVLCVLGREALTAYLPSAKGPVFMKLIEMAFGTEVTTRTWETVKKCAAA